MIELESSADFVFGLRELRGGTQDLLHLLRDGGRETWSCRRLTTDAQALALALDTRGVGPGDRVALWMANRPEWLVTDFACQLLGAVSVPLGPSLPADNAAWALRNCGATWIAADAPRAEAYGRMAPGLTSAPHLLAIDDGAEEPMTRLLGEGHRRAGDVPLDRFRDRVDPDAPGTIVYTAGTVGEPKGVVLSRRALAAAVVALADALTLEADDHLASGVSLAHPAERALCSVALLAGVPVTFVSTAPGWPGRVGRTGATVLGALVSDLEPVLAEIRREVRRGDRHRRRLVARALELVDRWDAARATHRHRPWLALRARLARRVFLAPIRRALGDLRLLVCYGGSPTERLEASLRGADIGVVCGYGLTEAGGFVTLGQRPAYRRGAAGRPLPGNRIRVDRHGEIHVRGPSLMTEYWRSPEMTAERLDDDGWLATGDLGVLDRRGILSVVGRFEDMATTTGGTRVNLRSVERRLCLEPAIGQAVLVADDRPWPVALLVPRGPGRGREVVAEAVDRVARELPEDHRIRRFALLDEPFTVAGGEITTTGEPRRRQIATRRAAVIESLYGPSE